ncbi:TAP-like protein-domain-containing protein [Immersiella caudata]|uniref:TAP-like protein-domain-containing protein n=1 Tax=Immersiella caudata TaxID=314043 RepID=A0AA40BWP2_9PEZI|nr:TAP-like protein-domain-containing protein [Immersiella caudata]
MTAGLLGVFLFTAFHHSKAWRGPEKPPGIGKKVDPWNPWASITPNKNLEWHPCYQFVNPNFQCARLTVPLNQNRQFPEVHIALIMLAPKNATAALASPKSPLLINPGGPGGPGTLTLLSMGPALQAVLGDDRPVIGFDPRGVGFTSPSADCWAMPPACDGCPEDHFTGLLNRLEWNTVNMAYGQLNSSNVATKFIDIGHRAVNNLCRDKNAQLGGESILGHAATPHVATDMVRIVDAWEQWVDQETEAQRIVPEFNPTKGKLVYWGFSYGTYLGATFASMYPDRVGRLVLDGVVDADYYSSPMWTESLLDADKVLWQFFEYCAGVGQKCPLYRKDDKPADVSDRYAEIIRGLEAYPPSFTHPDYHYPVVLHADIMRGLVFRTLYSPAAQFPALADLLNTLYEGRFEQLSYLFAALQSACGLQDNAMVSLVSDAQRAIMCGDKTTPVNLTLDEINDQYQAMAKLSQFADIWVGLMLECNGWNISRPHPSPGYPPNKQTNTSFPILFLSNTYDPVTPLHAAVKMALKFEGAGLVEQHAAGHCTVSAVSRCTAKKVRDYVLHGKVPPPPAVDGDDYDGGKWTTCDTDEHPWQAFDASATVFADEEEKKMAEALLTIRDTIGSQPRWGVVSGKDAAAKIGKFDVKRMVIAR